MSWNNKIIWSEGMFLQPHHFQQHDRYLEKLIENRAAPLINYYWGFSHIELNPSALMLGKIQLTSAHGIFPDGTPFDFPYQNKPPAPLDIKADLRDEPVFLALPMRRDGTEETNSGIDQGNSLARFSVDETDIKDSNAETNSSATIQIGQLNLKLLPQRDITDAYTALSVAQIIERRPDNQIILQKEFVPPILNIHIDNMLLKYFQELQGLIKQCGDELASLIAQPGHKGIAEIADFLRLQIINRYEVLFAHYGTIAAFHPESFYRTCLSLAGDLAIFDQSRRPPKYPIYQHDELIKCFEPLMVILRRLIELPIERNAISIELQDRQRGYWLAIINDKGLFKSAQFILAVNAHLPAETLRAKFPDLVKIGPVEKVQELVNLALPGIPLIPLPVAPRQIPFHAGFNYFELDRNNSFWNQLEYSGGLGMHIAGNFSGLELELWAITG